MGIVVRKMLANSADPDQTAPKEQSDQGLHCLHRNVYGNNCSKVGR